MQLLAAEYELDPIEIKGYRPYWTLIGVGGVTLALLAYILMRD